MTETKWEVRYGQIVLGTVDSRNMNHGLIRRRIKVAEVSGMSVG
jgi:hypothetical protein